MTRQRRAAPPRSAFGATLLLFLVLAAALAALAPQAAAQIGPDARRGARADLPPSPMPGAPAEAPTPPELDGGAAEAFVATFERWRRETARARDVIAGDAASNAALEAMRDRLSALRDEARRFAERQQARAEPLQRELDALGAPPETGEEDPAITRLRESLTEQLARVRSPAAAAQVAAERFAVLIEDVSALMRERLRTRVLTRGPSPLAPAVWLAAAEELATLWSDVGSELRAATGSVTWRAMAEERAPLAVVALLLAAALGVFAHRRVVIWASRVAQGPDIPRLRRIGYAAVAAAARLVLPLMAAFLLLFAMAALDLLGLKLTAIVEGLALGLLPIAATYALASAYYAPDEPGLRLAHLDDRSAAIARRAAVTLSVVVGVGIAVTDALTRLRFGEELLIVAQFALTLIASYALIRLRRVYRDPRGAEPAAPAEGPEGDEEPVEDPVAKDPVTIRRQFRWLLRRLFTLVAIAGPTLSALGYFAAAYEIVGPALRSFGVLGLAALLYALSVDLAAAAAERAAGKPPRLVRLAPLIATVVIALGSAPLLALAWGASFSDVGFALSTFLEGFEFSGVQVSPVDFLVFLGVFALGYALTRLLKRVLRGSVLPQLDVEPGASSALESGVGYLGVIVAALLAISAAGLDLSNLAIVAGALSVGVGFGLQTIVNNFVSGLILLIERPIKTGDWIEVNGIHGTVRRVNVRSTEIETFDRSAYIVPNADLVSAPVTNYTHKSVLGRLIVQVRCAYGTDPRRVEAILKEASAGHPMVLRRPEPMILFRAFGADGMEFEIRAYLRDVNYILFVGSDLHFEIAKRFREEGIEIPFGQRDLWFRNASDLAEALSRAGAPPAPIPLRAPQEAATAPKESTG